MSERIKEINLGDLGVFAEALTEIDIRKVDVPDNLKIPNWPEAAGGVLIELGEKTSLFPEESNNTSMLLLKQRRFKITFNLNYNGTFGFTLEKFVPNVFNKKKEHLETVYRDFSTSAGDYGRTVAVILFHQFQEEICTKLIEKLKADIPEHDKTMEMVEKAMAPFIPFLVADALDT